MDRIYSPEQKEALEWREKLAAELGGCAKVLVAVNERYQQIISDCTNSSERCRNLGLGFDDIRQPDADDIQEALNGELDYLSQKLHRAPIVELVEPLPDAS